MLTGVNLLSLRSLRLDALPPPGQVLLLPFRRTDAPSAHRHRARVAEATLVHHIPLPDRPLIRAAWTFLMGRNPDPRQRVFAGISPMHERIAEAADRCGLRLPAHPPGLIDAWLLRVTWTNLDAASTPTRPGTTAPAGPAAPPPHPPGSARPACRSTASPASTSGSAGHHAAATPQPARSGS